LSWGTYIGPVWRPQHWAAYAACPTGKERKRKEGGNGRDLSGILKRKRWQPTLAPGPTSVVNTMSLTINKQTIHYRQQ